MNNLMKSLKIKIKRSSLNTKFSGRRNAKLIRQSKTYYGQFRI